MTHLQGGALAFLAISSSVHLIPAARLFDCGDQSLAVDVALHDGSLGAVIFTFVTL